jgi:hypothetical protein
MTAAIPAQRHPAEDLPPDDPKRKEWPSLWVCPTCGDRVRICPKPTCITAEIDHDVWQDRLGDSYDD